MNGTWDEKDTLVLALAERRWRSTHLRLSVYRPRVPWNEYGPFCWSVCCATKTNSGINTGIELDPNNRPSIEERQRHPTAEAARDAAMMWVAHMVLCGDLVPTHPQEAPERTGPR